MSANDLMIDLETMSTSPMAAVWQVGLVWFDRDSDELGEKVLINIELDSTIKAGLGIDGGTIQWWMRQSEAARIWLSAENVVPARVSIRQALEQIKVAVKSRRTDRVWSHGAGFDLPILDFAFRRVLGHPVPWDFWDARDTRTLFDDTKRLFGFDAKSVIRKGVHHQADADAEHQALQVQACYKAQRERLRTNEVDTPPNV